MSNPVSVQAAFPGTTTPLSDTPGSGSSTSGPAPGGVQPLLASISHRQAKPGTSQESGRRVAKGKGRMADRTVWSITGGRAPGRCPAVRSPTKIAPPTLETRNLSGSIPARVEASSGG